jgi:cell division protein FtsB
VADDRRAPQPLETPGTAAGPVRAPSAAPVDRDGFDEDDPRLAAAETAAGEDAPDPDGPSDGVDLSSLSIAGITRRRVAWVAAALVSAWIVVVFARQAAEASTAANRADDIARQNAALVSEVAALEGELALIERPAYVAQQARGYRLGTSKEIPFTLDPSVPSPGPNAAGSASGRVGSEEQRVTPLESWLSLLFGPADRP